MKNLHWLAMLFLGAVITSVMLTGCSMTRGYIGHSMQTEVQLSEANFDVVRSVTGQAQADYFFGIGPSEQDLLGQAKRDMVTKADLKGSEALINVTTDIKNSWFLFWRGRTAYVSAEVVRFK